MWQVSSKGWWNARTHTLVEEMSDNLFWSYVLSYLISILIYDQLEPLKSIPRIWDIFIRLVPPSEAYLSVSWIINSSDNGFWTSPNQDIALTNAGWQTSVQFEEIDNILLLPKNPPIQKKSKMLCVMSCYILPPLMHHGFSDILYSI